MESYSISLLIYTCLIIVYVVNLNNVMSNQVTAK